MFDEPIFLFTDVLCNIPKSCMPKTTAKQKKRCTLWINAVCKVVMKARKSALLRFRTNITTDKLSKFRIARRACRENKRATVEHNLLGIWFVESVANIKQIPFTS